MITLSDGTDLIVVSSSHESTYKVLNNLTPKDIIDLESHCFHQVKTCIFDEVSRNFTVICETIIDEKDYMISREFELLDVRNDQVYHMLLK